MRSCFEYAAVMEKVKSDKIRFEVYVHMKSNVKRGTKVKQNNNDQ